MAIKFAVLRTHDGHAYDLLRPGATVKAGIGGFFDILANGQGDRVRVSLNGIACEGNPPKLPADLPAGVHDVLIEHLKGDAITHSEAGHVEVTAPPAPTPEPEPQPEPAASE